MCAKPNIVAETRKKRNDCRDGARISFALTEPSAAPRIDRAARVSGYFTSPC
jgi:hypothetical protein